MRYAGEFKFAGGTADPEDGHSLEATAKRELREEYELAHVPPAAIRLHPFNVKQTKPIQGRSYVMHNFVALASENPWLADAGLTHRTNEPRREARALRSGGVGRVLGGATPAERAALAPEVRAVEWLPMKQAAWMP